jgi:TRAP-type C4-dicarboxylate transport system permease small subunit
MSNGQTYRKVDADEYAIKFGIIPENRKKREAALERAWKNRDFEIDKFWTRSAYFWGFIALIFGGYFKIMTGKNPSEAEGMYLDLYLILLGIIFSVAWLLVIKGSKQWQENWEAHIDNLENDITGPLHKTVCYKGTNFYSVSKINEVLAVIVIVAWVFLFFRYFIKNIEPLKNILKCYLSIISLDRNLAKEIIFRYVPVIGTILGIIYLTQYGQSSKEKYKVDLNGKEWVFVDRASYSETPEH